MAKKGNNFRGFRKVHAKVTRIRVYVCTKCGVHHEGKRPEVCIDKHCGGLAFASFDSKGEAGRWATLVLLEARGTITNLQRQVRFDLMAAYVLEGRIVQSKVGEYWADFTYDRDSKGIIEDFKGAITDLAAWKIRHMEAMGQPVLLTGN